MASRAWKARKVAAGLCKTCGKNPPHNGVRCAMCAAKANARTKERRDEIWQQVLWGYGSECACCGEREQAFLSLDHVNGGGNVERKQLGNSQMVREKALREGFPSRYQLLCHNCNMTKHFVGKCPHQQATAA